MSKVDWSKAPGWAVAHGRCGHMNYWMGNTKYASVTNASKTNCYGYPLTTLSFKNVEVRPTQWPETDERIDRIGRDRTEDDMGHYNELREAQSAQKAKAKSKYHRIIKGAEIDVYSVLKAYGVTCPAIAHAIKKLLLPGERHAKTWEQDINEAIASLERARELRNE